MKQKPLFWLFPLAFLTACEGGIAGVDAKKFLEALEGPKVTGVQDTLLESAQRAEQAGDYKQAASLYTQLIDRNPLRVDYKVALANLTRRAGDPKQALALYENILRNDPANTDALEGLGLTKLTLSDFTGAEGALTQAVSQDSRRWRALNGLGIVLCSRAMYDEAIRRFDEAMAINENNPAILNNRGLALALNHDFNNAVISLVQASKVGKTLPERMRSDMNLALVYAAAGRLADAEQVARQHLSGASLSNNMGFYAYLAKDRELAKTYLNMAVTESKSYYGKAWDNMEAIGAEYKAGATPQGKRIPIAPSHPTSSSTMGTLIAPTAALPAAAPAAGTLSFPASTPIPQHRSATVEALDKPKPKPKLKPNPTETALIPEPELKPSSNAAPVEPVQAEPVLPPPASVPKKKEGFMSRVGKLWEEE